MNNNSEDAYQRIGYCGLFCSACSLYIATNEEEDHLEGLANRMNKTIEEIRCNGCRSDKTGYYCTTCEMKICAINKNINFCSECNEYPCTILKEFQVLMPHRIELFESLEYAKNHSVEEWEEKMILDYSCQNCGTLNSPYYITCRKCGNDPGNPYINRNKEKIINHFSKK